MGDTIRVATWNVGGLDLNTIARTLTDTPDIDVLGLQEAAGRVYGEMLRDLGFRTSTTGWLRTAWDPDWVHVRSYDTRLSPTPWTSGDGKRVLYADANTTILCDRHGRSLTGLSFKLPPHIQPADRVQRRVSIATQALSGLDDVAADTLTTGFVAFSDDNYDLDTGTDVPDLEPLIGSSPVLRLLRPPAPTLGDRDVDVIRVTRRSVGGRLVPTGNPWVTGATGPNTHRLHGRELRWT